MRSLALFLPLLLIAAPAAAQERAMKLHERIRSHFSQDAMVEGVLAGYRDALGAKFTQSH